MRFRLLRFKRKFKRLSDARSREVDSAHQVNSTSTHDESSTRAQPNRFDGVLSAEEAQVRSAPLVE